MASRRVLTALSVVVFLGTVLLAAQKGSEVFASLRSLDPRWALVGLASYGFNYGLRTLRLCALARDPPPAWPTGFAITGYHGFLTYMLPIQSGDLALPLLLRAHGRGGWGEGTRVLVLTRLLDLSALGVWLTGAAAFSGGPLGGELRALWVALGVMLGLLPWLVRAGAKLWRGGTESLCGRAAAALRSSHLRPGLYARSLLIWASTALTLYASARAVGLDLGTGGTWFLVTVQLPLQVLPIQGFANSGNHEAGWVVVLSFLGFDSSRALAVAIASHTLLLAYVVLLGCAALLARHLDRRRTVDERDPSANPVR